jgi:hypothetical protein
VVARADDARRSSVVERPDPLAVEPHLVRRHRARLEALDQDQCVVVTFDLERASSVAQDLDLTAGVRLHPDGRLRAAGVAKQWSDDERGS